MGAFDSYSAASRCPRCHTEHFLSGQTKFFLPDFLGLHHRHFVPGAPQPIDFDPSELRAPTWDDQWLRLAEPSAADALRLLVDYDETFVCSCELPLAIALRFQVSPTTVTLLGAELRDALSDPQALDVDFVEAPPDLWKGDFSRFRADLAALAAEPLSERLARVRAALALRLTAPPGDTEPPWTVLRGPARCEACDDARERQVLALLSHPDLPTSFFGPDWRGGDLRPGDLVPCDTAWLADDLDRGYWLRARHPVPPDSLTLLVRSCHWGCRCGAGPASFVARFARTPAGLRLVQLTLRAVRTHRDLADIDFIEAPGLSRDQPPTPWPSWRPSSRDEALAHLARGWHLGA